MNFMFHPIDMHTLSKKDLPDVEYLVQHIILKQGFTYIVGAAASFKTNFMLNLAIHGFSKPTYLNYTIDKPFRTLFIDEENGLINTKYNLNRLLKGNDIDLDNVKKGQLVFSCIAGFKIDNGYIEALEELIKKCKPDLIVMDNIARIMVGSEQKAEDVSKIYNFLKPVIEKYGVSIVMLHHCRKGDAKSLDDIAGSRDFGAQCDNAFLLREVGNKKKKKFMLKQLKAKLVKEIEPINFEVEGDEHQLTVTYAGTKDENVNKLKDEIKVEIITWIGENPQEEYRTGQILTEFHEIRGHGKSYVQQVWYQLKDENFLSYKKKGVYTLKKGA